MCFDLIIDFPLQVCFKNDNFYIFQCHYNKSFQRCVIEDFMKHSILTPDHPKYTEAGIPLEKKVPIFIIAKK